MQIAALCLCKPEILHPFCLRHVQGGIALNGCCFGCAALSHDLFSAKRCGLVALSLLVQIAMICAFLCAAYAK